MTEGLTVGYSRVHRVHRKGICPVLEVTVEYPVLTPTAGEPSAAVCRFNAAYRAVAEGWLSWAEGALLERVLEEFDGAGVGATYRFIRRRATYRAEMADPSPSTRNFTVSRSVRLEGNGEDFAGVCATDTWRWPDLTLASVREGEPACRNP